MRNSIASYKESLSRIAHEVLDAAEEERENGLISARQISQLSRSTPFPRSLHAKGTDSGSGDEIANYRADIQRLQASEAEIKALSFNYVALLKGKEEQLFKLRQENGLLRRSLEDKKDDGSISRDENPRTLSNSSAALKGNLDRAFSKHRRIMSQENSSSRTHPFGSSVPKQNGFENGPTHQNIVPESANSESIYKENEKLLEEVKSLKAVLASHQAEMKLLKEQLDNEHGNTPIIKIKLQEEHHLNESAQQECHGLINDKEKISEAKVLEKELDRNLSELIRLQEEVSRKDMEKAQNESLERLKSAMQRLEKENSELRVEKNELEVKLKGFPNNIPEKNDSYDPDSLNASKNKPDEVLEMTSKIRKLEEMLKATFKERDKAVQDLSRLKQHLLDKELEDEDKMDEDSKIIEELRTMTEYQRAQILSLENTLSLERAKEEDLKKLKSDELDQSNETIKGLKQKLANCMSIVDAKNVELQNLQTALGQYYAESEAKERFGRQLDVAREESAKLSGSLKVAEQSLETSKRENEEISSRLSQTERMLLESRRSLQKLEEDNSKLRHALERSMITLNRMSLDSDNFVDRRIVIKLLVTYFQRNHSKEVLDLMVRMLGFSEEDKQRIGFAQHSTGKGVVRGVLGLPGRLVGGILGGNTNEASSRYPSENQSFADLWVDFLLKETEERERWESSEDVQKYSVGQGSSTSASRVSVPAQGSSAPSSSALSSAHLHAKKVPNSVYAKQYQPFEPLDAEFLTVPLSPASPVSPSLRAPNLYCHRETD